MSTWWLVGIIVFVLAFIVSNIVLLKKSANMKFSSTLTEANKQAQEQKEASSTSSPQQKNLTSVSDEKD